MIKVRLFLNAEGRIAGYSVSGHSGMAEYGKDIVCAGVSVLAQTALLGLLEQLHAAVDYRVESGDMEVALRDAPDDATENLLQTMLLGLRQIAAQAPEAVSISEQRDSARR